MSRIQADIWHHLIGEPLAADALAARPAVPATSVRVLAAVDRQSRRHLLIELASQEVDLQDRRSRGIDITTRALLLHDGSRGRYLDLLCRESFGFDVFDSLGAELAGVLAAGIEEPAIAVQRLVGKWRRFWVDDARPILSREEQIGLFAELWFLTFWLIPKLGVVRSIEAWRGPLSSRHDIELKSCSIEVKATASGSGRTHRIHGIDQLQTPEGGPLLLFSLAVREEGGGANNLPTLIERARELVSADDETSVRFETKLAQTGYTDIGVDAATLRLRVVDERLYKVEGSFPKVTRTTFRDGVPAGVDEITYSINLNGFENHIIARRPDEFDLM